MKTILNTALLTFFSLLQFVSVSAHGRVGINDLSFSQEGVVFFTAVPSKSKTVDLKWETVSQTNVYCFSIEKTIDGIVFETVDVILGTGSIDLTISYASIDKNPFIGTSYYRLKQINYDGVSSYSDLVPVKIKEAADGELTVFPNPSNDRVNVVVNHSINESIEVSLINQSGKKVYSTQGSIEDNQYRLIIDKGNFIESGVYFVLITGQHILVNQKVVIF